MKKKKKVFVFSQTAPMMDVGREFSDINPIGQDDGPHPVCSIKYSDEYSALMGYFRACLATEELSERVLRLTMGVIETNPANYTAWHYRRKCLVALNKDLAEELYFTTSIGGENPKNYQIWYHRRAILEDLSGTLEDARMELDYVAGVLAEDSKNYHAWSHRQHLLTTYGLWDGEIDFVCCKIDEDIRNNSAWNQRWFAVHGVARERGEGAYQARTEVEYALAKAEMDCFNESPFKYIEGILTECWTTPEAVSESSEEVAGLVELVKQSAAAMKDKGSPHVHSVLVEIFEREGKLDEARELCGELKDKVDVIRAKYWSYRMERISVAEQELEP